MVGGEESWKYGMKAGCERICEEVEGEYAKELRIKGLGKAW